MERVVVVPKPQVALNLLGLAGFSRLHLVNGVDDATLQAYNYKQSDIPLLYFLYGIATSNPKPINSSLFKKIRERVFNIDRILYYIEDLGTLTPRINLDVDEKSAVALLVAFLIAYSEIMTFKVPVSAKSDMLDGIIHLAKTYNGIEILYYDDVEEEVVTNG